MSSGLAMTLLQDSIIKIVKVRNRKKKVRDPLSGLRCKVTGGEVPVLVLSHKFKEKPRAEWAA